MRHRHHITHNPKNSTKHHTPSFHFAQTSTKQTTRTWHLDLCSRSLLCPASLLSCIADPARGACFAAAIIASGSRSGSTSNLPLLSYRGLSAFRSFGLFEEKEKKSSKPFLYFWSSSAAALIVAWSFSGVAMAPVRTTSATTASSL